MKFTIRTEVDDGYELTSSNELIWAVDRLQSEDGSFLVVEPETPVAGITYMQATYVPPKRGLFGKVKRDGFYSIEVQEQKPNGDLYQYIRETEYKGEITPVFCQFFEAEQLPDLTVWNCELFFKAD